MWSSTFELDIYRQWLYSWELLGVFEDAERLRADNFDRMKNRKFDSSIVGPMSANLAFVLYRCGGNELDDFIVKLYINEEEVSIPACNASVCSLGTFMNYYESLTENCNFDTRCRIATSASSILIYSWYNLGVFLSTRILNFYISSNFEFWMF